MRKSIIRNGGRRTMSLISEYAKDLQRFMHKHEIAVDLYKNNGIQANFDLEIKHQDIIKRFGRYPHRNKILGRVSSKEEIQFLKQPGSGF